MSLLSAAATRLLTSAVYLTRLAVHRLGLTPAVLAVAAVAAAIYSWRTRRPARRAAPAPASQPPAPATTAVTTAVTTPAASPSAAAAAAPVPAWLPRVRRVTLGAKWTREHRCDLFAPSPTGAPAVRPDLVSTARSFARAFDLYLVVHVESDDAEAAVRDAVQAAGLFDAGLDERKLLFCETDLGKVSIARQLETHLHVDESVAVVAALQRFVPYVALVTRAAAQVSLPQGPNLVKMTSLATFRI